MAGLRSLSAEAAGTPGGVVIPAAGDVGATGVLMPAFRVQVAPPRCADAILAKPASLGTTIAL